MPSYAPLSATSPLSDSYPADVHTPKSPTTSLYSHTEFPRLDTEDDDPHPHPHPHPSDAGIDSVLDIVRGMNGSGIRSNSYSPISPYEEDGDGVLGRDVPSAADGEGRPGNTRRRSSGSSAYKDADDDGAAGMQEQSRHSMGTSGVSPPTQGNGSGGNTAPSKSPRLAIHAPPPDDRWAREDPPQLDGYADSPDEFTAALQYLSTPPPEESASASVEFHRLQPPPDRTQTLTRDNDPFTDFDGVHYSPDLPRERDNSDSPPQDALASARQALEGRQKQYGAPAPPKNLVYYPAKVPAVLNLPPLMSKNAPKKAQKRQSQLPSPQLPPPGSPASNESRDGRRSVAYPGPGTTHAGEELSPQLLSPNLDNRRSVADLDPKRMSQLPPHLRASAYFDAHNPPPPQAAPEIKGESAVDTLDSILNASAKLPPAAFTDHPITGASATTHANRNSGFISPQYRNSIAVTVAHHPGDSPRSSIDGRQEDDRLAPDAVSHQGSHESFEQQRGLPTTLLAELESRKTQQRSRNRTAASAFPTGIRSTLLQLDAVAQVQASNRRQRRTHLAWEAEDAEEEERDEDVPLGLLYAHAAHQQKKRDEDVPLGLLVKKEMEDGESLAQRRERLRQEQGLPGRNYLGVPIPGEEQAGEQPEEEGETLAQRRKRLANSKRASSSMLDLNFDKPSQPVDAEEETLGQRRARLAAEKERRPSAGNVLTPASRPDLNKRASMMSGLMQQNYPRRDSAMLKLTGEQERNLRNADAARQARPQQGQPLRRPTSFYAQLESRPRPNSFYNNPAAAAASSANNVGLISSAGLASVSAGGMGGVQTNQHMQAQGGFYGNTNAGMSVGNLGMPGGGAGMMQGGHHIQQQQMMMQMQQMQMQMAGMAGGKSYAGALERSQQEEMVASLDPKQREVVERWRASVM